MPIRAADAVKQVAEHARALVRLELELAALELKRKLVSLGFGIGLVIGSVLVGFFALAFGLAAAAAGVATVLPTWAALLVVMGGLGALASLLGLLGLGRIRKATPPVPEQAIEEARKTTEALRSADGNA